MYHVINTAVRTKEGSHGNNKLVNNDMHDILRVIMGYIGNAFAAQISKVHMFMIDIMIVLA